MSSLQNKVDWPLPAAAESPCLASIIDLGKKFASNRIQRKLLREEIELTLLGINHASDKIPVIANPRRWIFRHLSLDIMPGEIIGVVGPNGSGKSTLMRILAGIITPSEGQVILNGRVIPLVNAFGSPQPELSGRDNIIFLSALMGMRREKIVDKLSEIAKFAGLQDFLDLPMRHYSKGMMARLNVAVGLHSEGHLFLADEILATSDQAFRTQCRARIKEIVEKGAAFLIVSHDFQGILDYCTHLVKMGPDQVIEKKAVA